MGEKSENGSGEIPENGTDTAKKIKKSEEQAKILRAQAEDPGKGRIVWTKNLIFYLIKFALRLTLFLIILVIYLQDRSSLGTFMVTPIWNGITVIHVAWCIFMGLMLMHLLPSKLLSMARRKSRRNTYMPVVNYDRYMLLEHVQKLNLGAWKVMLVWLIFNSVFGVLYLLKILVESDLMMLTTFYFLCDYICILFFCPFQSFLMKNKCCINCRIYDWGHFMMFTPMLFICKFYSWSLFFTSLIVLIHWEIEYAKNPERFWEGSNQILKCIKCKERTCQIKRRITGVILKKH
ncbi:MAG: hypothetical protein J5825_03105 [Lachnospiraceae bacterium]|nr:hypothetical protein [Lachnospiraceae bacterium]